MDLWFGESFTPNTSFNLRVKEQLFHGVSPFQTVDVFDTHDFGHVMTIDGNFMVTERDEFVYHDMITHVPLCAHKNPERVLVIGGGDGGTVREVLKHPGVKIVELCEIDGMVVDAARLHFPTVSCGLDDPRARIHVADGIDFVKNCKEPYDVILVDSTDPQGPAEGLFNRSFYESAGRALKDDGVLVVQSEGPFWKPQIVRDVVSTLRSVFTIAELYTFPAPTYPLGYWSFTFASKTRHPVRDLDSTRANEVAKQTRYYNAEIHRAAFALPNFVRQALAGTA